MAHGSSMRDMKKAPMLLFMRYSELQSHARGLARPAMSAISDGPSDRAWRQRSDIAREILIPSVATSYGAQG